MLLVSYGPSTHFRSFRARSVNLYCSAYNTAKRTSNRAVHQARSEAEKVALQKIDPRSGDVY